MRDGEKVIRNIVHKDIGKVMRLSPNWLRLQKFLKPWLESGLRSKQFGRFIYQLRSTSRERTGSLINQTTFIRQICSFDS